MRQVNGNKIHDSFTVNTPALMGGLATRVGLEVVAMDTDSVARDCIVLLQKAS